MPKLLSIQIVDQDTCLFSVSGCEPVSISWDEFDRLTEIELPEHSFAEPYDFAPEGKEIQIEIGTDELQLIAKFRFYWVKLRNGIRDLQTQPQVASNLLDILETKGVEWIYCLLDAVVQDDSSDEDEPPIEIRV